MKETLRRVAIRNATKDIRQQANQIKQYSNNIAANPKGNNKALEQTKAKHESYLTEANATFLKALLGE